MSGPFNVGDVVVCVDAPVAARRPFVWKPKAGAIYKIAAVGVGRFTGEPGVDLFEYPEAGGEGRDFYARRFRHLPKADETFTTQIRACKPIRVGEPA